MLRDRHARSFFTLTNSFGDVYRMGNKYLQGHKKGDKVFLIYSNRTEIEDGVYSADTVSMFPDDDRIVPIGR